MKKEKKGKDFIKAAYYEGGRTALDAYVKKELRYPEEALKAKIEGTVTIRYTVDYKGKVIDAHVVSGLGHGCDEEAIRVVRSLTFKVPEDGKIKSKFSQKVNIHFRLPGSPKVHTPTKKVNAVPAQMQIQYTVTQSQPSQKSSPPAKSSSYQISLSLPNKNKINE